MKKLILGIALGALAVLGLLNFHIVSDGGGTFVVKKATMTMDGTYIDTRKLGVIQILKLPAPVREQVARRKLAVVKGEVEKVGEDLRRRADQAQSGS